MIGVMSVKSILYLATLVGILWCSLGLLMLVGYSLLSHFSPFLNDFLNVSVKTSKWFLAFALFFTVSGLCTSLYALARANRDNYMVFLSFAFSSNASSIAVQIYRMVAKGIGWWAADLLGTHSEVSLVKWLSIFLLLLSLILLSFQFSLIRMERRAP